jgi:hypothetical protein
MTAEVEMRCPVTPRRLFGKIRSGEATIDRSTNTIQFACDDCRTVQRRMGEQDVARVLHEFDMMGRCVDTRIVRYGS